MIPDVSPCCACANIKIRPQHAMSAHPTARPLSLILTSAKNKVRRELQLITAPRHYFSALNCRLWWSVGRGERLFLGSPILSWCGSLTAMMGLSILLLEVVVVKKIPKTFTYFVWASLSFRSTSLYQILICRHLAPSACSHYFRCAKIGMVRVLNRNCWVRKISLTRGLTSHTLSCSSPLFYYLVHHLRSTTRGPYLCQSIIDLSKSLPLEHNTLIIQ